MVKILATEESKQSLVSEREDSSPFGLDTPNTLRRFPVSPPRLEHPLSAAQSTQTSRAVFFDHTENYAGPVKSVSVEKHHRDMLFLLFSSLASVAEFPDLGPFLKLRSESFGFLLL